MVYCGFNNLLVIYFVFLFVMLWQLLKVKVFIISVVNMLLENIDGFFSRFSWEYEKVWFSFLYFCICLFMCQDVFFVWYYLFVFVLFMFDVFIVQGEFYYWVDLFNYFEVFFE